MFAGVLNLIGCWIRCLAIVVPEQHRFTTMMIGQIIASIGGPFIYKYEIMQTYRMILGQTNPFSVFAC
jgi:hypothetical protein